MKTGLELLGYIVGEAKPYRASFVALRPPQLGEYVYMEYSGYSVVGLVETSITGSTVLTEDLRFPDDIERIVSNIRSNERMFYYKGSIRILGDADELKIPPVSPIPGTKVWKAPSDVLEKMFAPRQDKWIRVGVLLRAPDVEAKVDINKVVTRHLAILAKTGMGKSNLVALLAKKVVRKGGTIIIFDYHGEYKTMKSQEVLINVISPRLNPKNVSFDELARIIGIRPNAIRQRAILKECKEYVDNLDIKTVDEYLQKLKQCLKTRGTSSRDIREKVLELLETHEKTLQRLLGNAVGDVLDRVVLGAINVIDLSELRSYQADAVIAHWIQRVLEDRKLAEWSKRQGMKYPAKLLHPVVLVIEEAHVFISSNTETASKYQAELVVREGRKFGVGLVIVSQRPRGLDPNILSQIGSLAVLRIVHPEDQIYIAKHCEPATQELMEQLPGLNVGEAILVGEWVRVPTVAKIDLVEEKVFGADIDAVSEWTKTKHISKLSSEIEEYIPPPP